MKIEHRVIEGLSFIGPGVKEILNDHPRVVRAVEDLARRNQGGVMKVYVAPRAEDALLEWTISVTSPAGRQTYELVQRSEEGKVYLNTRSAA